MIVPVIWIAVKSKDVKVWTNGKREKQGRGAHGYHHHYQSTTPLYCYLNAKEMSEMWEVPEVDEKICEQKRTKALEG